VSARVNALRETLRLATQRRDAGLSNDVPVLDATLRQLAADRALRNLLTSEALARVALVAALGGPALDPQLPSPTPPAGAP
jgi:outer membrane protein TolC